VDSLVADSGGKLIIAGIIGFNMFNQSRKVDYRCVREEKNEYIYMV
jgi:hypothetical protein